MQFQAGDGGGMIVDIIRMVRLFFGRKINGKGAMLETMTFGQTKNVLLMSQPEALSDFGQTKNSEFSCHGMAKGAPVFCSTKK